ncbi:hypothetical protein ZWY2020_038166 [Hordeum vulgare]|nr:hypothetical protein ZWY2020_038166 [Hordeum vulgare]
MASTGQVKMVAVLLILFAAVAHAVPLPPVPHQTCIHTTSEVPAAGDCICSKNCACAGKCILAGGTGDHVKACFIDCVLKNDCRCNDSCFPHHPQASVIVTDHHHPN